MSEIHLNKMGRNISAKMEAKRDRICHKIMETILEQNNQHMLAK